MFCVAYRNILDYTFPMKNILLILLGLGASLCAQADVYKYVDSEGRVTYTNVPIKGATKLDIEPSVSSKPATNGGGAERAGKATPTPNGFPRVEKSEQKARDDKRRQILEDELAGEIRALEAAKEAYAEAEKNPEVFSNIVGIDGKPVLGAKEGQTIIGANGQPVVGADGNAAKYQKKRGRNMAKYAEKLKQLSEEIKTHENNVEMLELELSRM